MLIESVEPMLMELRDQLTRSLPLSRKRAKRDSGA